MVILQFITVTTCARCGGFCLEKFGLFGSKSPFSSTDSNCLLDDRCSLLLSFLSLDFSWDNTEEKHNLLKRVADGSQVVAGYLKEAAQKYSLF